MGILRKLNEWFGADGLIYKSREERLNAKFKLGLLTPEEKFGPGEYVIAIFPRHEPDYPYRVVSRMDDVIYLENPRAKQCFFDRTKHFIPYEAPS